MKCNFLSRMQQVFLSMFQKILPKIKQMIPTGIQNALSKVSRMLPSGSHKWLLLALVLVLIVCLVCCFPRNDSNAEKIQCIVAADNLDVHKKADSDSKIVAQLPYDLEIEILEQKTVDDTVWGRIEETELPDGTTTKSGWIDLQFVKYPGDPELEPTEPITDTQPEPATVPATMGTVTAGKLNIRKAAGSEYEIIDEYLKGDRIEIIETVTVDDTVWGRTGIGWVGMGYVRMDGTAAAPNEDEDEDSAENKIVSDGSLGILGYGVVDLGTLNVRSGPGTEYEKVGTVLERTRYAYYQTADDWVRIEDGWVSKEFFYMEGTTAEDAASGTVTSDDLNIRTGPHTTFQSIGTYNKGDTVEILAQVDTWGYTAKGWISMSYVELNPPTYSVGTGTVTSGLNIRKEPNADSEMVDTYKEGDRVTITEVSGEWGKTDKGWINLKYVDFD